MSRGIFDYAIGVDIGGTKIASALVSSKGKIVSRVEEQSTQGDKISLISQIAKLIRKMMDEARTSRLKIKGIGIACGPLIEEPDDKIEWSSNLPHIQKSDLEISLRKILGTTLPIFAVHDHIAPVLGEHWVGAARKAKNAIYIMVGTGIDGSLLIDGKVYDGVGLAGSIGWLLVGDKLDEEKQRKRRISRSGNFSWEKMSPRCFESLCSGPNIVRRTIERIHKGSKTMLMDMVNNKADAITCKLVFEAARRKDPLALKIVQETATYIGIVVSNLISTLAPEVVIIGGGVGRSSDLVIDYIKEIVELYSQPTLAKKVMDNKIRIVPSPLNADAPLYGAAKLVFMHVRN